MQNPIVHAEIIGTDPAALRDFYGELFGWTAEAGAPVASTVSRPDSYAFNEPGASAGAVPIGIGGGDGYRSHTIFYVGVDDVPASLARAVELGATVIVDTSLRPDGGACVAKFADPEGNLVGLAGPA